MNCPHCQTTLLRVPVTGEFAEYVPEDEPGVTFCPQCLTMDPDEDPPAELPDFTAIADAFPQDREGGVPMLLAVGLLTSLALYRTEIQELFAAVEEAGHDPMLVLDRLAVAGSVDSRIDLQGRKRQLEQLLE